jgi:hypothetical protein
LVTNVVSALVKPRSIMRRTASGSISVVAAAAVSEMSAATTSLG